MITSARLRCHAQRMYALRLDELVDPAALSPGSPYAVVVGSNAAMVVQLAPPRGYDGRRGLSVADLFTARTESLRGGPPSSRWRVRRSARSAHGPRTASRR
ncbi:sensory rhodopsin transducer [Nonomuraea polychroma]|uniref:sensory rhodopsin transducer n=1 Tax=Nonomuraea polychroma TaxID=46176 RepID=UPI003BA955AF